MSQRAKVTIEFEEHFENDIPEDNFDEYDDVDDICDFTELVWRERLEQLDMDGRVLDMRCEKMDN